MAELKLNPDQINAIVQATTRAVLDALRQDKPPSVEITHDAPGVKRSWEDATWIEISTHAPGAKEAMGEAVSRAYQVIEEGWKPMAEKWFRYLKPNFHKFDVPWYRKRVEDVFMGTGLVWPTFSEREMYRDANSLLFVIRRMMEYAQDPEVFFDTDPAFQWGLSDVLDDDGATKKLKEAYKLAGEAYWICLDHNSYYLLTDHINNFDGEGLAKVKDKVLKVVEKAADYSLLRHFQDKMAYSRNPDGISVWLGAMEA